MLRRILLVICICSAGVFAQMPPIEPGVSKSLAEWRAAHYSDVRYKLNLTLEKMSPVLKGTLEVRVKVDESDNANRLGANGLPQEKVWISAGPGEGLIILDWRKIKGSEHFSTISNVTINGRAADQRELNIFTIDPPDTPTYTVHSDHLIFWDGREGENVIKLDFTSPILASGSAITRYIDKEDGSEYIYSLFVPSDASTAFPVFDQPDLKARFTVNVKVPSGWKAISNSIRSNEPTGAFKDWVDYTVFGRPGKTTVIDNGITNEFFETKPISTYVFAFAAGPFEKMSEPGAIATGLRPTGSTSDASPVVSKTTQPDAKNPVAIAPGSDLSQTAIYVRRSQAAKFQPHAAEVFRLNRESVKYFEEYFDYKFPFPKYDLVLIPEFPFGGMEQAGATFLRESAIIFPQEPTKSDHISRAVLIFHEAAHQWFGDTVTMKWFDDLWLKEGFANFMAYKAVERIMPDANAWKVFYERIKQPAYATDSTRGTTPIYQPIDNLNSAKSAYGNIVYNKAPAFLKQAEFYLGPEKFQTAVRAFLKKHEFKNARWEDLVKEFETASGQNLKEWSRIWVKEPGLPFNSNNVPTRTQFGDFGRPRFIYPVTFGSKNSQGTDVRWRQKAKVLVRYDDHHEIGSLELCRPGKVLAQFNMCDSLSLSKQPEFIFPNYQDYGYGIFLLDDKSRDYVLKNVQNEKDAFLRSMMYGALWDSVREGELDPRAYVEVAIKNLPTEQDETIAQMMLTRTATALGYYLSEPPAVAGGLSSGTTNSTGQSTLSSTSRITRDQPPATAGGSDLRTRFESVLIDRIKNASTLGQRITFYRAFLNTASSENGRQILRDILNSKFQISDLKLKTKDKFDIVIRLAVLNDPEAAKLLAELEKTETSDDAKRYAYAARAAFPTKENREKYWNDFVNNKDISESWIEAAFGPFNAVRNSELSLPYLKRALEELPNHKRNRKIFFVNGWLAAFIGGQRSQEALDIVNKFLTDNPNLDKDLRLKILENVDIIERAVGIRKKFSH